MKKQQLWMYGILAVAVYLISTGISTAVFSYSAGTSGKTKSAIKLNDKMTKPLKSFMVDPAIPKTEMCPINGKLYTMQEKTTWETRRPLAIMIENHAEARPQSGLSLADIVYEAVAEGGVSRFMGIFYCGIAAGNVNIAPVRSARTYFLPWVLEYDALYNHVGGA